MAAKRGKLVTARISEQTNEWFENMANGSGLPKSTLVAFVLGEWVYKQRSMYQPMMDAALKAITDTMTREMDNMEEIIEKCMPEIVDKMAQHDIAMKAKKRQPCKSNSTVNGTQLGPRGKK